MRKRFRKKPVVVDAVCWTGDNVEEITEFGAAVEETGQNLQIWNEEEGCFVTCPLGHWVIKGVNGEFYPCSADVLVKTYEPVGD